jgi:hypothetical protein
MQAIVLKCIDKVTSAFEEILGVSPPCFSNDPHRWVEAVLKRGDRRSSEQVVEPAGLTVFEAARPRQPEVRIM